MPILQLQLGGWRLWWWNNLTLTYLYNLCFLLSAFTIPLDGTLNIESRMLCPLIRFRFHFLRFVAIMRWILITQLDHPFVSNHSPVFLHITIEGKEFNKKKPTFHMICSGGFSRFAQSERRAVPDVLFYFIYFTAHLYAWASSSGWPLPPCPGRWYRNSYLIHVRPFQVYTRSRIGMGEARVTTGSHEY